MDPKKELLEIMNAGLSSEEDKKMWSDLIQKAPDDFAFSILDALKSNPEELSWFNDIYKRKIKAFELAKTDSEKAKAMLREILEEEKEKIQELNSKE